MKGKNQSKFDEGITKQRHECMVDDGDGSQGFDIAFDVALCFQDHSF